MKRIASVQARMETVLDALIPRIEGPHGAVTEAMRYAALEGGKRLRPFLVVEIARLIRTDDEATWNAAAALECIHVYSLIHDDLPCMDDDALRRGKPTVHIAFDEAMAVLAGDALQTRAFEILTSLETAVDNKLELVAELASASGVNGMIGGQVIDITADEDQRTEELITRLQSMKTGALIKAAVRFGAILSGASATERSALDNYADDLGLLFQITDDILDVEGDASQMGKAARKDENLGKATFVSILGLAGAKEKAAQLAGRAKGRLEPFGEKAQILSETVDYVLLRDK